MAELIYADPYGHEIGYLAFAEGDFTIGKSNTFELKVPANIEIDQDWFVMIEDSEYGGVVDGIEIDTTLDYIIISGRTWHGILETSVLKPDKGQAHVVVSGDANMVMRDLIERQGLGFCLCAAKEASGFELSGYTMLSASGERHSDLYSGFRRMLKSVGAKLRISYDGGERKAMLSAVERGNYVDDGLDGDRADFTMKRTRPFNHTIALGSGELQNRLIVEVFADAQGNVSDKQSLFGIKHKCDTYENVNCDNLDDLRGYAVDHLKDLQADLETCGLSGEREEIYDVDDIVGTVITERERSIITHIAQKIASIDENGNISFETKTELEV